MTLLATSPATLIVDVAGDDILPLSSELAGHVLMAYSDIEQRYIQGRFISAELNEADELVATITRRLPIQQFGRTLYEEFTDQIVLPYGPGLLEGSLMRTVFYFPEDELPTGYEHVTN